MFNGDIEVKESSIFGSKNVEVNAKYNLERKMRRKMRRKMNQSQSLVLMKILQKMKMTLLKNSCLKKMKLKFYMFKGQPV